MPVRCRARVLRIEGRNGINSCSPVGSEPKSKLGVAVRLESYEYLAASTESSPGFSRISGLHAADLTMSLRSLNRTTSGCRFRSIIQLLFAKFSGRPSLRTVASFQRSNPGLQWSTSMLDASRGISERSLPPVVDLAFPYRLPRPVACLE